MVVKVQGKGAESKMVWRLCLFLFMEGIYGRNLECYFE